MKSLPMVSIIIPTYNGSRYIVETIDSCTNQSYKNIELIVLDDKSTDETLRIVDNHVKNKNGIKIIRNDKNLGLIKSINIAVSESIGDFLIFLGHDDILPKNHVENIISEFDNQTVFVHCNSVTIDGSGNQVELAKDDNIQFEKNKNIIYELSKSNFIHSCGAMIRKSTFLKVGGADEKYRNYGEWLYWIKMANTGKVKFSTATRSFRRKHERNLTKTFREKKNRNDLFKYKCECRRLAYKYATMTISQKFIFWSNYFSMFMKNTFKMLR